MRSRWSTGGCCSPGWVRSRHAGSSGSAGRPVAGGGRRTAACHRNGCPRPHSGRYLSLSERKRIATLRERGLGIREIADRLERSPSTVSRELRRNVLEHDKGVYDADLAHHRSRQRIERPRRPKLRLDNDLRAGPGQARARMEPRADRRAPARSVAGPARAASVPREHLPRPLPGRERRAEQDTHQ
ncbi:helix-turn-helix domain-containing protein [Streptomyces chartreusis]|uniref:helix-turn-helix domain-containing protein n=1 Tax=Streptomyces chartreusis TaxID=1969 RepID=UPI0037F8CD67